MNKSLGRCPVCGEHYFKETKVAPSVDPFIGTVMANGGIAYYHLPVAGGEYIEGAFCVAPCGNRPGQDGDWQ